MSTVFDPIDEEETAWDEPISAPAKSVDEQADVKFKITPTNGNKIIEGEVNLSKLEWIIILGGLSVLATVLGVSL